MQNSLLVKSAIAGVLAGVADKYILKRDDLTLNVKFGASVAAGVYAGDVISAGLPTIINFESETMSGKTVQARAVEITSGSLGAYALNKYILKNDFSTSEFKVQVATIAGVCFVAEYLNDYLTGQALSYLK